MMGVDPVQIETCIEWRNRVPTYRMGPRYIRLTKPSFFSLSPTRTTSPASSSSYISTPACAVPLPANQHRAARPRSISPTAKSTPCIPIPTPVSRRSWTRTRHPRLFLRALEITLPSSFLSTPSPTSRPFSTTTHTRFQRRMNLINPRDERGYIPIADHGL